jgi:hypothetical protein
MKRSTGTRSLAIVFGGCAFGMAATPVRGQWQSLNGGVSHEIRSFCTLAEEEVLLVGGNFPWLLQDSVRVNNMAAWDGFAWSTDHCGGGNGSTYGNGTQNPVLSMVDWNDTLYCGFLDFDWQGDTAIDWGAYLTEDTLWHAIPGEPNGPLMFAPVNGRLFMGGNATAMGSMPFPGLCEVIGGQPVPLPGIPFDPAANIWAFEYWQGNYYFGGQISTLDVGSRNIVGYNGVDGWFPLAQGIGGNHIRSIRGYGDSLYVGGFFTPGNNVQSTHIQIWDGQAWHPFFPDLVVYSGQVFEMEVYEDALWILGTFQFISGGPTYAVLKFDGQQLCAIGGPEYNAGSGNTMAFFQGHLYKGMGTSHPGLENQKIGRLPLEGLVPDECYDVVTAVAEPQGHSPITLFPNPVDGTLSVTGLGDGRGGMIEVFDVFGKPIHVQRPITSPSTQVDLTGVLPGCYQLRVSSPTHKVVRRFMKR